MHARLPPLESLRVFEASARHRNFSRAALELGVTPTAVSLRIRNLESELGKSLFERNGPRITLTEAGATLAERIGEALALTRSAVAACRDESAPLRLTVTPTFALRWLVPRLPFYQSRADAAPIRLDVSSDLRAPNQFDIAIRSGRGDWSGESRELFPILRTPMLSAVLAAGSKLKAPSDLLEWPLLYDADDSWPLWFRGVGLDIRRPSFSPVEYATQDMEATAVARGAGVALLSPILFGDLVAAGVLVQPFSHVLRRDDAYHVVRHPGDSRPGIAHFVGWLREEAQACAAAA